MCYSNRAMRTKKAVADRPAIVLLVVLFLFFLVLSFFFG